MVVNVFDFSMAPSVTYTCQTNGYIIENDNFLKELIWKLPRNYDNNNSTRKLEECWMRRMNWFFKIYVHFEIRFFYYLFLFRTGEGGGWFFLPLATSISDGIYQTYINLSCSLLEDNTRLGQIKLDFVRLGMVKWGRPLQVERLSKRYLNDL